MRACFKFSYIWRSIYCQVLLYSFWFELNIIIIITITVNVIILVVIISSCCEFDLHIYCSVQ